MTTYVPGDRVEVVVGDEDPPDGTLGTVEEVGVNYGDGIDIILDDGRCFNILDLGIIHAKSESIG